MGRQQDRAALSCPARRMQDEEAQGQHLALAEFWPFQADHQAGALLSSSFISKIGCKNPQSITERSHP